MKEKQIKIEGRSGCKIEFVKTNEQLALRKYASSIDYNSRLEQQWIKQNAPSSPKYFFTPRVLNYNNQGPLYWFEMEYVSGDKYSNYFTRITKDRIDEIIFYFQSYFNDQIKQAKINTPPNKLISNKIDSLINTINNQQQIPTEFIHKLESYLRRIPQSSIYIGECHGDFTLSNMLFLKDKRICLFDLLDSFIESPIIDWVKLKQDTRFKWSMHIENETQLQNTKLLQVLSYIDEKLNQLFRDNEVIQAWEPYLTVLNLARILPYAKDERDNHYLIKNLITLI